MEVIYSILIYVPILTASVMFGGYIGFLIWVKLNWNNVQYGMAVGGAVGFLCSWELTGNLTGIFLFLNCGADKSPNCI